MMKPKKSVPWVEQDPERYMNAKVPAAIFLLHRQFKEAQNSPECGLAPVPEIHIGRWNCNGCYLNGALATP